MYLLKCVYIFTYAGDHLWDAENGHQIVTEVGHDAYNEVRGTYKSICYVPCPAGILLPTLKEKLMPLLLQAIWRYPHNNLITDQLIQGAMNQARVPIQQRNRDVHDYGFVVNAYLGII